MLLSTYLGGDGGDDSSMGLSRDEQGRWYWSGHSTSVYLPGTPCDADADCPGGATCEVIDPAGQPEPSTACLDPDFDHTTRPFPASYAYLVLQLAPDLSELLGGRFIDGPADDIWGANDYNAGSLVAVGQTLSDVFPTTAGAFDESPNGDWDISVVKMAP